MTRSRTRRLSFEHTTPDVGHDVDVVRGEQIAPVILAFIQPLVTADSKNRIRRRNTVASIRIDNPVKYRL